MKNKNVFTSFVAILLLACFISCKSDIDNPVENITISYISEQGQFYNEEKTVVAGYILTETDLRCLNAFGYDFLGWFIKGNKATEGQKLFKDSVLVAKWKKLEDNTAPAEVTGLKSEVGDSSVLLKWTNPSDSDFYGVEISSDSPDGTLTNPVILGKDVTSFNISGLNNNKKYVFKIRTFDNSLNYSNGVTVEGTPKKTTGGDITPPKEIVIGEIMAENGNAIINWTNPNDGDFSGVEISLSPAEGTLKNPIILSNNVTNFCISNLTVDKNYKVTIKTFDDKLNYSSGVITDFVSSDTLDHKAPLEVSNLEIISNNGEAKINWINPKDKDFRGTQITMIPATGTLAHPVSLEKDVTSFTVSGLENGTNYTYTLKTFDNSLNYSNGNSKTVKTEDTSDKTPPVNITDLKAISGDTRVQLTWKDPTNEVLFGIEITYTPKIFSRSAFTMESESILIAPKSQYAEISKLNNDTEYTFTVKTVDLSGNKSDGLSIVSTPTKSAMEKVDLQFVINTENKTLGENEADYGDKVSLKTVPSDAVIYYTVDGSSIPPVNSNIFTEHFNITDNITIKAVAMKEGMKNSDVISKTYNIKKYSVTFNKNAHGTTPKNCDKCFKKNDQLTENNLQMTPDENSGFEFNNWIDADKNIINANHKITKDLVLTANWNDIAPQTVKELTSVPESGKVTLSWINPADKDLEKIIITSDPVIDIQPLENAKPNEKMSTTITGLTNDTAYTFTVKAIDKGTNESLANNSTATPIASIKIPGMENTPQILSDYQGSVETGFTYVQFGIWPQTKYSSTDTSLKPCSNINAWDNCYTDGKNGYYIKVQSIPSKTTNFPDGTILEKEKYYYFKLEPIVWRVLTDNYNGKKLLLAEKALATHKFNGKPNNKYDISEIRAFLNGYNHESITDNGKGFLQKAFTQEQINAIADTVVDNSENSTTDATGKLTKATNYVCPNTTDKIFLLSEKEVTTNEYGFANYNYYIGDSFNTQTSTRLRTPTDYAIATGIDMYNINNCCYSWWWLRSPYYGNSSNPRLINERGSAMGNDSSMNKRVGVVPALSISF